MKTRQLLERLDEARCKISVDEFARISGLNRYGAERVLRSVKDAIASIREANSDMVDALLATVGAEPPYDRVDDGMDHMKQV